MSSTIPAETLASARLTASAWGRAYIGVTMSTPDRASGGRWMVSRAIGVPHFSCQPVRWIAAVTEDGTVEEIN